MLYLGNHWFNVLRFDNWRTRELPKLETPQRYTIRTHNFNSTTWCGHCTTVKRMLKDNDIKAHIVGHQHTS